MLGGGVTVCYKKENDSKKKIAGLNDLARKYLCPPHCRPVMTGWVAALPATERAAILQKVRSYNHFPKGDDPYGERDFGAFNHNGKKIFWKIDYYDKAPIEIMERCSEDPADPEITTRVLTIMLAEEY